jgi:hypothetical protein
MIKDSINCGETYVIPAEARDDDGVTLVMDGTWSAACRIISKDTGATVLDEADMDIIAGTARLEIDTGNAPWAVGIYLYDVRITDPEGHDFWSAKIQLSLLEGITPKSS